MDLSTAVRQALLANELSNNAAAAYRFSNAGASSGLSFGATQLDVSHNSAAVKCLQECGFTAAEIIQLKNKSGDWKSLSPRLLAHAAIVDKYDTAQIKGCLDHVLTVAQSRKFSFANDEAIVHAADYHNQFFMATAGKMANALAELGRAVTPQDIYQVIEETPWDKKDPEDVKRRYNNIARLMGGAVVA